MNFRVGDKFKCISDSHVQVLGQKTEIEAIDQGIMRLTRKGLRFGYSLTKQDLENWLLDGHVRQIERRPIKIKELLMD